MDRVRRALKAIKMSEMAQLGAQMRKVDAARREAAELRATARNLPPAASVQDMLLQDRWRQSLEDRARAAEARAEAARVEAAPLGARLAQTLGRENVTDQLIATESRQINRAREARAEDESSATRRPTMEPS